MPLLTYLLCPELNDLDHPLGEGSLPGGQRSLATQFPRRRLTFITTPGTAIGCPRFALAATAGDETVETRRIQVMRDWEAPLCFNADVERPGDGRVTRWPDSPRQDSWVIVIFGDAGTCQVLIHPLGGLPGSPRRPGRGALEEW
jgi:hypothetical protein